MTVKSGSSTLQNRQSVKLLDYSSDISGYHADFNEGHDTVGAGQGHGMAGEWHAMCESAFSGLYVKVYIVILVCLLVLSFKLICNVLACIKVFLYFCQLISNWQKALNRS
jgi:hypothetical protein